MIFADSEGEREFWAKFSKICKITYNAVGGTVDSNAATSYVEGTGLTLTHKVVREGYLFAGWYAKSDYSGGRVGTITAEDTGDKVFYAKWAKKESPAKDADGCYVIKTVMELYGFAAIVNGTDGFEQDYYACASLANDIVVNQDVIDENGLLNEADKDIFLEWTPIMEYGGVFDGRGHSVSGLYFNDSLDEDRRGTGFFGSVDKVGDYEDVVIKNLGIEKSYFAANDIVGALMGRTVYYEYEQQGDIRVVNCYSTSTVHSYEKGYGEVAAGGLVGGDVGVTKLYIENSYNAGRVEYRSSYGGGLVGWKHYYEKKNYLTIVNSHNIGPVVDLDSGKIEYDLIGRDDSRVTIENSYYPENVHDNERGGTPVAMELFKNGSVARLLHDGENGSIWGQNVGVDEYPNFSGVVKNFAGTELAVKFHTFEGDTAAYFKSYFQGVETALPDTAIRRGFEFRGWYADSALSGETVTSISKESTEPLDFYAKWERLNFEVSVYIDKPGRGRIDGLKDGRIYAYEEVDSVVAYPVDGYRFAYWADDVKNTNPVLAFKVLSDTTLVAHFEWIPVSSSSSSSSAKSSFSAKSSSSSGKSGSSSSKESLIAVAQVPSFTVTVAGRDIQVSGVSAGRSYALIDMQGSVLRKGILADANVVIPVDRAGSYLVRVGGLVQRVSVK
jgi:uncharacterized repeat protein (TIGR02543 family)